MEGPAEREGGRSGREDGVGGRKEWEGGWSGREEGGRERREGRGNTNNTATPTPTITAHLTPSSIQLQPLGHKLLEPDQGPMKSG